MMHVIDSRISINLRHVVRIEKNSHTNKIHYHMADGRSADKGFDSEAEVDAEIASVTTTINAFGGV